LLEEDLAAIRQEAVSRWLGVTGNDPEVAGLLDGLVFTVSDLDGRALAQTFNTTIRIDVDAAGNGWFIDPTPGWNEEFALSGQAGALLANTDSDAYAKYDLLTVVMHEIGHALGIADVHQPGALMNQELHGGTRAKISAEDAGLISLDGAQGGNQNGAELSDQEKILGGLDEFASWAEGLGTSCCRRSACPSSTSGSMTCGTPRPA